MSRPVIHVAFPGDAPSCAYVRGSGANGQHFARELLTELRGRPPLWASTPRAWATTPRTARDLIAVAESRDLLVEVLEEQHMLAAAGIEADSIRAEHAASKGFLW